MSRYLGYIAPAIAFLATVIGLLGPSRLPNMTGIRAITPFGWTSAAIAATSLCVALFTAYRREADLTAARAEAARARSIVFVEIGDALTQLENVLRYAALMPYTTTPAIPSQVLEDVSSPDKPISLQRPPIDLRSQETISRLEKLYLSPTARLKGPYIPSVVPFGTDVVRPSMIVLVEESGRASRMIETAVQKYAGKAMPVEVIESASAILRAPFLKFLMSLSDNWARRSTMEDSSNPKTLKFLFLNSGITGGYTTDYVHLLDDMGRLQELLGKVK
jgi:hypothetical protein